MYLQIDSSTYWSAKSISTHNLGEDLVHSNIRVGGNPQTVNLPHQDTKGPPVLNRNQKSEICLFNPFISYIEYSLISIYKQQSPMYNCQHFTFTYKGYSI